MGDGTRKIFARVYIGYDKFDFKKRERESKVAGVRDRAKRWIYLLCSLYEGLCAKEEEEVNRFYCSK